jgi:hypothetical protein
MNAKDKKITDVLAKFGEPFAGNVWTVQGTPVIYHKALERIAAQAKIAFDIPTIVRAERDEAVMMVVGRMGDRMEWSIGEAVIGTNYRVSGKQAAYVWAMAEKRAKDRVILKLIELSGDLYSEEEADEFKEARPSLTPSSEPSAEAVQASKDRQADIQRLKNAINAKTKYEDVSAYMLAEATRAALDKLPEGFQQEVRDHAIDKMIALGWEPKPQRAA